MFMIPYSEFKCITNIYSSSSDVILDNENLMIQFFFIIGNI